MMSCFFKKTVCLTAIKSIDDFDDFGQKILQRRLVQSIKTPFLQISKEFSNYRLAIHIYQHSKITFYGLIETFS